MCGDDPRDAEVHGEGLRPHDGGAGLRGGIQRRLPARGYRPRRLRLCTEGHEGIKFFTQKRCWSVALIWYRRSPFLSRQSRESIMMKVNKKELKYKLNDLKYCLFLL